MHINADIICDLTWLANRIWESDGVFLLEAVAWHLDKVDMDIYTNACPTGIGFWCVQMNMGLYALTLRTVVDVHIFYHEAYAVV